MIESPDTNSIAYRMGRCDREAATLLSEGLLLLVVEVANIRDPAAQWDYAVAVDELLTAIGAPGDMIATDHNRPKSDDTRPMVQRLADPQNGGVAQRVVTVLVGLSMLKTAISQRGEKALADDLKSVFLAFIAKLKGDTTPTVPTKVPVFKDDEQEGDTAA